MLQFLDFAQRLVDRFFFSRLVDATGKAVWDSNIRSRRKRLLQQRICHSPIGCDDLAGLLNKKFGDCAVKPWLHSPRCGGLDCAILRLAKSALVKQPPSFRQKRLGFRSKLRPRLDYNLEFQQFAVVGKFGQSLAQVIGSQGIVRLIERGLYSGDPQGPRRSTLFLPELFNSGYFFFQTSVERIYAAKACPFFKRLP